MPDWLYHQSTGDIYYLNGVIAPVETAYSGYGSCKNNPDMQGIKSLGPIPIGDYQVGDVTTIHNGSIKNAIPLVPFASNHMFGRDGFFMHGDGTVEPGKASEGCIVCSLQTRLKVASSRPTVLHVVRGNG